MNYGAQSMVTPLKRVVVRRPDITFGNANPQKWHYTSQPNLEAALKEHDALVDILTSFGSEVIYHDEELSDHADAIFTHDPVIVSKNGAILLSMGKDLRKGEEANSASPFSIASAPRPVATTGPKRSPPNLFASGTAKMLGTCSASCSGLTSRHEWHAGGRLP